MTGILEQIKDRTEVSKEDKWNVEALYLNLKSWNEELKQACEMDQKPHWPELLAFRGKLGKGATTLKEFLTKSLEISRKLSKLFTYAAMRHDEDLANEECKKARMKIGTIFHEFSQEMAWVEPEILSLPDETIQNYLKDKNLNEYHFHLEQIIRLKPHTLSSEKEELIALAGMALGTPGKSFSAFNNADLQFPSIRDKNGQLNELTHAKYLFYMRGKDRELRKNAFQTMHQSFQKFENTICEMINGHVQTHYFNARVRNYSSCLEASLFPNQIDLKVYSNLIDTVRKHLPILHHYIKERKETLHLEELHLYDLYVPLVEDVELKYDYQTAERMIGESVAPLGKEYQQILTNGLLKERWVDRYENKRKRSGAYSGGCYDSMPYILMNFQGTFNDLMTLAHEAGHSMHSFLTHKHQPYHYGDYSIFLAEVASTFNEELMFHYLTSQGLSSKEKAFLINQKIEDIRTTFFRQTMFAEFELFIHKLAEEHIPITPGLLKEHYRKLNLDYFGPHVFVDQEIDIEWARIPHFYSNFYVYQYATGISAAYALFEKVMKHKGDAREKYMGFLSSGSSKYPLDLLEQAGVNMRHEQPIESIIMEFDRLVKELFHILKK